jgi:hypothetical protein
MLIIKAKKSADTGSFYEVRDLLLEKAQELVHASSMMNAHKMIYGLDEDYEKLKVNFEQKKYSFDQELRETGVNVSQKSILRIAKSMSMRNLRAKIKK